MFEGNCQNKVMDLDQAVKRYVKAGQTLHFLEHSSALASEVLRQFRGSSPGFTVISGGIPGHIANLVQSGMVSRLITTVCIQPYPADGPYPLIQQAYKNGAFQIENWSLTSLTQRLMAGAMGLPFMPTRSLVGSSIAEENADSFQVLADPFGSRKCCGIVKPLNPDISLIHAWAADTSGNVIGAVPLTSGDDGWGAKASLGGVIVSVEKIVPAAFIVEHAVLVNIPGYMVRAVCPVPFGAHPGPMGHDLGIKEFETYTHDYQFLREYGAVLKSQDKFERWIKEWVLDVPTHRHYLQKLGDERISSLKKPVKEAVKIKSPSEYEGKYSDADMMIIAGARKIQERILAEQYSTLLGGFGLSALSSWLACYQLERLNYPVEIIVGSGFYGVTSKPGHPYMLDNSRMTTAKAIRNSLDAYGVWVGGKTANCLSVLAGAQIDKSGNLNSTKFSENSFFVGSGGANDATTAKEVIAIMAQSSRRFVDKVYYVTSPGEKVKFLVSDMGIFEKADDGEFVLVAYFPTLPGNTPDEKIQQVKKNCGWDLKVSRKCAEVAPPSPDELQFLRSFTPDNNRKQPEQT